MQLKKQTLDFYWPEFDFSMRGWLPSKGNVLFTLLTIAGLMWAQNAGTFSVFAAPNQSSAQKQNGGPPSFVRIQIAFMVFDKNTPTNGSYARYIVYLCRYSLITCLSKNTRQECYYGRRQKSDLFTERGFGRKEKGLHFDMFILKRVNNFNDS